MTELPPTDRTRLRRAHERGRYDRGTIDAILDAQPVCHIAYLRDGTPALLPTLQWREGDHVYWHGSSASHALRAQDGAEVCLAVTLLDGLVLARSGFHHSVNYRSVTIYGRARRIEDPRRKERHLEAFFERLLPGRWPTLRPVTEQELKATAVLSLPIREASAKLRNGPPVDEEADYGLPIWAGVLPLRTAIGTPVPDPRNPEGLPLPPEVRTFRIG
ncbi:MAG TPA: pyridoxamine 5'-phosphate oxidase family protein [Rhodospirillales bacterium]|nr:pyridoxamine 5'-phosphate oxidase family protein [Rhodospirillales bacterium]